MKKPCGGKYLIIKSLAVLIFSVLILTTAVLAWFTFSDNARMDSFVVCVTTLESDVSFNIEGLTADNTLLLENAAPGKEYKFSIEISNYSQNTALMEIYFYGISAPVLDKGIYVDMCDVFKLNFKDGLGNLTSSVYFRDLYENSKIPILTYQLSGLETKTVEFYIEFSEVYQYYNTENVLTDGDINLFQGKNFNIDKLIIELN